MKWYHIKEEKNEFIVLNGQTTISAFYKVATAAVNFVAAKTPERFFSYKYRSRTFKRRRLGVAI